MPPWILLYFVDDEMKRRNVRNNDDRTKSTRANNYIIGVAQLHDIGVLIHLANKEKR